MLRACTMALAVLAVFPSVSAMAGEGGTTASAPVVETTVTDSGTTTYFGHSAPKVAAEAAKPKPEPLPDPTLTASVDLASQRMTVSVDGEVRYTWPISSGVSRFPTPTGTFRPEWTSKMWYSRKYDMAPMPHAVFINGGVAVHGTYHVAALGNPASHGCIRLSTANAKTFYNLVQRHGLRYTRVTVHGRPNFRRETEVASRSDTRRRYEDDASANNWFWGSWGGDSYSASAPGLSKKNKRAEYVYIDGVRMKVIRKNGQVYAERPKKRSPYKTYGYGYGSGY